jgi:hypothetical protein
MRLTSRIFYLGLVFALLLGTLVTIQQIDDYNYSIEIEKIEIDDNSARLKLLKAKYDNLNQALDKAGTDKVQLEQRLQELQREKESLQSELLTKKNGIQLSGTAHAEVIQSDDYYVNWIIQHESSGNAWAVNPSSGACGLFQKLPCNVPLGDVNAQMADGLAYIEHRYGTPYNAYMFWQSHRWY